MPSTLIRLAVALLAFGLGVSATMFWIAYRTPEVTRLEAPREARPVVVPTVKWPDAELPPPPPPPLPRAPLSDDSINDKILSKPAPVYPPVAVISSVSGRVSVEVFVDERGRVESAEAIYGHPLLRQAAVDAAYGARFLPTLLEGQPVKVMGVISYNFELP
jgi:protein TonB